MTDAVREPNESEQYQSAFPEDTEENGQLGPGNTVLDEPVRDGLDNAVENSQVQTRDEQ